METKRKRRRPTEFKGNVIEHKKTKYLFYVIDFELHGSDYLHAEAMAPASRFVILDENLKESTQYMYVKYFRKHFNIIKPKRKLVGFKNLIKKKKENIV